MIKRIRIKSNNKTKIIKTSYNLNIFKLNFFFFFRIEKSRTFKKFGL